MKTSRSLPPLPWLWAVGVGLAVFAARLDTMRRGVAEAPFLDQWLIEGDQVIRPWFDGRFDWRTLFAPHHEHYPVFTRLLAWIGAVVLRTWDPVVQGTINAAFFGVLAASFSRWWWDHSPKLLALFGAAVFLAVYAPPHNWENAIWGFQSSVPLCLLFSFWHIRGSLSHPTGSLAWWSAQAAGLVALGTFGGAWAAPLAVTLVLLWSDPGEWRRWLAPALIAAAGLAMLWYARHSQPAAGALALQAPDLRRFLGMVTVQVGWPSPKFFAVAAIHLPALLLALPQRMSRQAHAVDLTIVALAVFALAQAGAIAAGRSATYIGFVPRYSDFLALGVVANALALARLWTGPSLYRWLALPLAAGWCAVVVTGLREINSTGHTKYFRENAGMWAAHRVGAVKQYLATHDRSHLTNEGARTFLYPEPNTVARVLDTPGVAALLPAALRADATPQPGDTAGLAVRFFSDTTSAVLWSGALLALIALVAPRAARQTVPAVTVSTDPLRAPLLLAFAAVCGVGVFLWSRPATLDPEARLIQLVTAPESVGEFRFRIVTPSPYPPDNLVGGAALWPEHFRNVFFGTHIDGPAFTGRAESTRFELTTPYLLVPIAGYPASPGSGVLLDVLDDSDRVLATERYPGNDPDGVAYWSVDVSAHQGRSARLAILDGQAKGSASWVAVAPPQRRERDLGAAHAVAWRAEQTAGARLSLASLALAALLLGLGSLRIRRRVHST